jgi:cell fate regulator YaaT (PSP1 superfamily)
MPRESEWRSAAAPSAVPPWVGDDDDAPPPPRLVKLHPSEPPPPEVPVQFYDLCAVRLRATGPLREYDCRGEKYGAGEWVFVESERGPRLCQVVLATRRRHSLSTPRRVVRRARPDEIAERARTSGAELEAHRFCKEKLRERKLAMKLVQTELVPGQRATFYFASEERVDFRDLVRDLTQHLRTRIEMRQIGARDGAKAVGGIGSCGRELCCTTFLPAFQPISIRMAKDQGMVLNPSKLAGQCGRLKCCLVYEHQTYKEMGKGLPKVGRKVQTPLGVGRVLDLDILRQRARVLFEDGATQTFAVEELRSAANPGGDAHSGPEPAEAADSFEAEEGDAPVAALALSDDLS